MVIDVHKNKGTLNITHKTRILEHTLEESVFIKEELSNERL